MATTEVPIQRRSHPRSLEYVAGRLEAAVDAGTEQTLRTVASQAACSLRVLAAEAEEPTPPEIDPRVLNQFTGEWVPIPLGDLAVAMNDPSGYAERAGRRFRDEWNAEHPEDTHA